MNTHTSRATEPNLRIGILSFAHVHAVNYARQLLAMPGVEVRGSDPHAAAAAPASELRCTGPTG